MNHQSFSNGRKGVVCCGGLERKYKGRSSPETLLKCMNRFFMFALLSVPGNKGRERDREEIELKEKRWEGGREGGRGQEE